ncbi:hypothetical protein C0Q70_07126 [Pomacea canaliculata]|uniref:DRBM domain-containing protein n=1 Tax=Pomacea canaliculata TaxID=400727 RepID=A0A2T7PE73_POMCA|nr:microprocessor complex subunit DGCR8-like isoform X2 [Pomacea canaliculata]PVD31708.1 hypothetical protein C0Q70_07126 [Pomacea canaliculata]
MDTEEVYPTPDESSQECGNSPPSSQMEFQTINMSHGNTLKHSSEDKDEAEINAEPPAKIPRLTYEQETEHVGCADSGGSSVADSKDDDDGDMVDSPSSEKNMCPLPLHIEDEERMEKYGTHEFEIIDEVAADDDGKEENEQDSDDSLDDSELYALLEEGITKDSISGLQKPIEREKVVLVERGHDPFDILPEGWIVVTHNSGMPVYLHRESRVCTLAQPYFLGSGSARKHDIPVSAIPCLKYRQELEKERQQEQAQEGKAETKAEIEEQEPTPCLEAPASDSLEVNDLKQNGNGEAVSAVTQPQKCSSVENTEPNTKDLRSVAQQELNVKQDSTTDTTGKDVVTLEARTSQSDLVNCFPSVKIKSADEMKKETSLDYLKVRDYCKQLFEFKTVTVQRYKTWRDRRKYMESKKQSRPELPSSTKLITCSLPPSAASREKKKNKGKEFFLNPSGKSYVCILHEYVQHTMKVQPFYIFRELENSKTPYSATVMINDMEYGSGSAISKKMAKSEAAKNTLKILIPEMNMLTDDQLQKNTDDLSFFDEIKIEDPRISELGNKAGQPSPYQILRECLSRNYGMGDTECVLDMKPLKHQNCEFTITVGKHTATVVAKSKRNGKQRAAQAILQKLHPHVPSWGSLLRLYGNTSDRGQNAKKKEVNEVKSHRPNQAILDRLREEMKQLNAQKEAIRSRGRMLVLSANLPSKVSSVDL